MYDWLILTHHLYGCVGFFISPPIYIASVSDLIPQSFKKGMGVFIR